VGKVLSAQGSGYYPSCIQEGSKPDDPDYFDLTIAQGMALYWRTRRWRVDASGSFYSDGRGTPENPIVYSGGSELTPSLTITSEEKLVCFGNYTFYFNGDIGVESGTQPITFTYDFSGGYKTNEKFYPLFEVDSIYVYNSYPSGQKVGNTRFIFNNYTIVKDLYTNDTGASGDVLIDFTCIEYWSYGGTYDTATGNPL